jgi:hypothetical protein
MTDGPVFEWNLTLLSDLGHIRITPLKEKVGEISYI